MDNGNIFTNDSFKWNLESVEELLNNEADVNTMDGYKRTPLHFASEKGYLEIVNNY